MTAKLLVAEDDIFIRSMIAEFLRDAGFDVLDLERDEMKHVPPFVRPLVVGAATTPSAA